MERQPTCTYQRLENGIHELVLYESSRATVEVLFGHFDTIMAATCDEKLTNRYLIDGGRIPDLPLNYLMTQSRDLFSKYPVRAATRTAILYEGGMLLNIIEPFIRSINRRAKIHLFKPAQRDTALAWLLRD